LESTTGKVREALEGGKGRGGARRTCTHADDRPTRAHVRRPSLFPPLLGIVRRAGAGGTEEGGSCQAAGAGGRCRGGGVLRVLHAPRCGSACWTWPGRQPWDQAVCLGGICVPHVVGHTTHTHTIASCADLTPLPLPTTPAQADAADQVVQAASAELLRLQGEEEEAVAAAAAAAGPSGAGAVGEAGLAGGMDIG
jgi:hypothetical protein